MKSVFPLFFLILSHFTMAQNSDVKSIIQEIEHAESGARVRSLCMYFDTNVHNRSVEKIDNFLAEYQRIAERDNDKDLKAYLDFYKRIRPIMLIPDDEPYVRESKMPKVIEEALKYYISTGDERFIAICNAYIGHFYFITKEYEKSLEKLLMADEGFRKVGYDKFPEIGKHLHSMALVFYFFRDYDKVAELMEISIQNPPYYSNLHIQRYNTLGAAYTHMKQYKKAAKAFIKTKETAKVYKDTFWIAFASRNLANIYLEKGRYAEALDLYESNLKLIEQFKITHEREYFHYLLGLIKTCIFLNDLPKAREYLDKINYKPTSHSKEPMFLFGVNYQDLNYWIDFYDVKHRYHYALRDYKNAYSYSDSLYSIKYKTDSLFNGLGVQVAQNRIESQNKQFENDKKEATIKNKNKLMLLICCLLAIIIIATLLIIRKNRKIHKQNKTIGRQLAELSKSLEQKQVLLSELQHRVKNNLQHVISILEIQKESVDFNNIDELLRSNQNRIHSIALLHKKLNVTDNVNEVNFKKYITELAELVKESYEDPKKKILLNVKCEINMMSLEKALPLGLIITELVSNSMKHAFKKQQIGIIDIEVTKDETGKKLHYSDNGCGFDFNKANEKGLGQEIIKGLIDQLDGTTQTKREKGFALIVSIN